MPAEVLSRIENYPMIPRWDGDGSVPYSEPLPYPPLDSGQVRLARDGLYEEAPGVTARRLFAWRMVGVHDHRSRRARCRPLGAPVREDLETACYQRQCPVRPALHGAQGCGSDLASI